MNKLKSVKTGCGFFTDKSTLDDLKINFKSEVYASFDEYMNDLDWRSINENFHGELAFITESIRSCWSKKFCKYSELSYHDPLWLW